MAPARLMIIRHAEKPFAKGPKGVRLSGKRCIHSLTPRGWQRAGALVHLFDGGLGTKPPLARPDHIYAVRHDRHSDNETRRPRETVKPLAQAIACPVDARFGKDEESALVEDILKTTGTVLVSWSHEYIPAILAALPGCPPVPREWPGDRFDLVWLFEATQDGWRFSQVPQMLLAGDRPTPA